MVILWLMMVNNDLAGGFEPPLWKMMELVNGKDDIAYMKWKIKFMFETTNQQWIGSDSIKLWLFPSCIGVCHHRSNHRCFGASQPWPWWNWWLRFPDLHPPQKIWKIHENPRFFTHPDPSPYVALQSDFADLQKWFPKVRSSHLAGPLGSGPRVPPPPAHAHTCPAQPSEILFAPSGKHSKNYGKSPSLGR